MENDDFYYYERNVSLIVRFEAIYKYTQWSSKGVIIRSKNFLQIIEQTNVYFSIFDSCIYEIWAGRLFNQCNNTSIF